MNNKILKGLLKLNSYLRITIMLLSLASFAFSQGTDTTRFNQFNEDGKKVGPWIGQKGHSITYFKDGNADGLHIVYNRKNNRLAAFGEYNKGKQAGTWYYFDESGFLILTQSNIAKNDTLSRNRDDGKKVFPSFVSYAKFLYPNGVVKAEGQVLFDEDIEIDYYKIGTWKYFDEKGNFVESKNH